jgi:hypothetical protein
VIEADTRERDRLTVPDTAGHPGGGPRASSA